MTAVARVLPRDWDGHRLLRFLTGLAMLALAFAAHLAPARLETAAPAPPAAVASITQEAPALVDEPVVPSLPTPAPVLLAVAVTVVLTGIAMRTRAVRGPPLI